ncbi:MAG: ABC transporter ATP-binding protein [Burkholderiaceae bacterium]
MHSTLADNQSLLRLTDLTVRFGQRDAGPAAVESLSLTIEPGERLALVGESGSGKTVTALAVLGLVPDAQVTGQVLWQGEDLLDASAMRLQSMRGSEIAMVFQEPMTALNPLLTVGQQIAEVLETHEGLAPVQAMQRAGELMERVGIDSAEHAVMAYPHQLSGGQRQRVLIAMALACRPKLLIADEPTTALDVTLKQQVLDLLLDLQRETGMAILMITHDLPMVRRFAQRVAVMQTGRLVEVKETAALFSAPEQPYTKQLIAAEPVPLVGPAQKGPIMVEVRQLQCSYAIGGSWFRPRYRSVVNGVSFVATKGETLGIVGESGSGKTTLGLALLRLSSALVKGQIRLDDHDILGLTSKTLRGLRRDFQVVFQDPFSALSPRQTVAQILEEGLLLHAPQLDSSVRRQRCEQALLEVGMPIEALGRYPHAFSGGQRQRIAIARALIVEPKLLLLDEPTSALDLSVQKQILELLVSLQRAKGLTYVLISHDLAVMRAMAHRVLVMRHGNIVEFGATEHVLQRPRQPYTQNLLDAAFPTERLGHLTA